MSYICSLPDQPIPLSLCVRSRWTLSSVILPMPAMTIAADMLFVTESLVAAGALQLYRSRSKPSNSIEEEA